ncbi:fructose-6-phosphate aldolase [Candidatus Dependentiae bacterium]|nr:fructose-6-phosphate aldolase [Candidatus Dependentiae bacterium]
MKIFLDTANREMIERWIPTGIIDGVTTNPSLLSKEGKDTRQVLLDICEMVPGDVSIEVVKKDPVDVYKQSKEIAALADNVVVKIPFAFEYLPVIAKLTQEGVRINVTLIFSLLQALMVAKLGVTYISPFIGRLDDIDVNGLDLIHKLVHMVEQYSFASQILAASIRHVMHLHESVLAGVDVATVPPKLLDQLMSHPLTLDGIRKFDDDWKKLGKQELLGAK